MVMLLQLSIKQELKLSDPAVHIKKDKKAIKELMVCPKKKKRKQRSPAKVQVSFYFSSLFKLTCMQISKLNEYYCTTCLCSLYCFRFSA